jgi:hypothetical protein
MEKFPINGDSEEKDELIRRDVYRTIEELKNEGYEFEFSEEGDEFIIGLGENRKIHVPAWKKIPTQENDGIIQRPVQDVIRECILESKSDFTEGTVESEKEARLESIREKLRDFGEKEKSGEIESNHLIPKFHPGVNIEELTEEDLEMFEKLETSSIDEVRKYIFGIPEKDENRKQFAAFLGNMKQAQANLEFEAKRKNKINSRVDKKAV